MSTGSEYLRLAAAAAAGMAAGFLLASGRGTTWLKRPKRGEQPLLERLTPESLQHRQWMQRMEAFIFDIDGVIHVAGTPVPGAPEALAALEKAGKRVMFMTNNATVTPESVVERFRSFGAVARPEQVMTSAIAAAAFLNSRRLEGQLVYVIGMDSLVDELSSRAGVRAFGASEDGGKTKEDAFREFKLAMVPPPEEVAAVVVGADYLFNYYKLARAANYLRQNPNCLFVATNPDPRVSLGDHAIVPAAGSLLQAVATACGREPTIVCGKPSRGLALQLLESEGFTAASTCMVGDRTDTDIEFGRSVGMETLFVESGSMTLEEVRVVDEASQPRFVAASIATLAELLKPP